MSAAGDATTFVRRSIERIGRAYGLKDLRVSVGTSLLLLSYRQGDADIVDLTTSSATELRLDQVAEIYRLADEAEHGAIDPRMGLARLRAVLARPASNGALVGVAGLALISAGVSLVLAPSLLALLVCLFFGALVGAIRLAAQRWPGIWPLLPVVAGAVVATIGLTLVDQGLEVAAVAILIPPLAVFLPGAAITVAMIELSAGDIVSGGSRLAFAAVRLLLLVFGIVIAAETVHWEGSTSAQQDLPLALSMPASRPCVAFLSSGTSSLLPGRSRMWPTLANTL